MIVFDGTITQSVRSVDAGRKQGAQEISGLLPRKFEETAGPRFP
jgi:hypothetical protein